MLFLIQSGRSLMKRRHSNSNLASVAEEIEHPVECWTVDSEPSTQNTREDVVVDGIEGGGQIQRP